MELICKQFFPTLQNDKTTTMRRRNNIIDIHRAAVGNFAAAKPACCVECNKATTIVDPIPNCFRKLHVRCPDTRIRRFIAANDRACQSSQPPTENLCPAEATPFSTFNMSCFQQPHAASSADEKKVFSCNGVITHTHFPNTTTRPGTTTVEKLKQRLL